MKPVLALDLDDMIFPFMESFVPYVNIERGLHLSIDEYITFDFDAVIGGTRAEAVASVNTFFTQLDHEPEPVEGALEVIERLGRQFELFVVTSRQDELRESTLAWIDRHLAGHFSDVLLCNTYATDGRTSVRRKADVCCEIGAVALVDDSLTNTTEAAAAGVAGLLFGNFAWSRCDELPAGVRRVAGWADVEAALQKLPARSGEVRTGGARSR